MASSKRPAPSMELVQLEDGPNGEKRFKGPGPRSIAIMANMSESEREEERKRSEETLARIKEIPISEPQPKKTPKPVDRHSIENDLNSGKFILVFEYNNATNAKCRASRCVVYEDGDEFDERIRSTYRLCLQADTSPNIHWKSQKRLLHVSCLEAIGIDISTHLNGMRVGYNFHPMIVHWKRSKGKAFDANQYDDFKKALDVHQRNRDSKLSKHQHTCLKAGECTCGLLSLTEPGPADFIAGEPSRRGLTDVLLHVMDADHLKSVLSQEDIIRLVEVVGRVPPDLTKAALAADEEEEARATEVNSPISKSAVTTTNGAKTPDDGADDYASNVDEGNGSDGAGNSTGIKVEVADDAKA